MERWKMGPSAVPAARREPKTTPRTGSRAIGSSIQIRRVSAAYQWPRDSLLRLLWRSATIAGIAYTLAGLFGLPFGPKTSLFFDLHAYWSIELADLYGTRVGSEDAFLYSPVAALAFWPITLLPWGLVTVVWVIGNIALVVWMRAGPLLMIWPFADPILVGNVTILYAAMIVVGMRWPAAWAFMALTKITPAVGVLWYAARGEWRRFAVAAVVTAVLAAVSFIIMPGAWIDWASMLTANLGADSAAAFLLPIPVPLVWRLPVCIAVTIFAARTDRAWLLPVAVFLALPVLWFSSFAVLLAMPALYGSATASSSGGHSRGASHHRNSRNPVDEPGPCAAEGAIDAT